jgi:hypothetical protein
VWGDKINLRMPGFGMVLLCTNVCPLLLPYFLIKHYPNVTCFRKDGLCHYNTAEGIESKSKCVFLTWNCHHSQNKNRLMSFRRKLFVSGHLEPVIEPTNADAPDTQLVLRRPAFLLL